MAEGGFELEDMNRKYGKEYDRLDREDLDNVYGRLEIVHEDNALYDDVRRRMEYIDSIRGKAETSFTNEIPDPKYDERTYNSSITRDKKDFLSKHLGVDSNVKDGRASEELIHKIKIASHSKGVKQNAIEFEGVRIVMSKDKGNTFDYSTSRDISGTVGRLIEKPKEEHAKRLEGPIDKEVRSEGLIPNEDVTQDIASNVTINIETLVEELEGELMR